MQLAGLKRITTTPTTKEKNHYTLLYDRLKTVDQVDQVTISEQKKKRLLAVRINKDTAISVKTCNRCTTKQTIYTGRREDSEIQVQRRQGR